MQSLYHEGLEYNKKNFAADPLPDGNFENCKFVSSEFQNGSIAQRVFVDCTFKGCNLSLVKVLNTSFRDVIFEECKILGVDFNSCNPYGCAFEFKDCKLDNSNFFKLNLIKIRFHNCSLKEVDFSNCNLSSASFHHCDLSGAIFNHSNLEKSDFTTSSGYVIDPEINKIKKAKFSLPGIKGLLEKYDIIIK